MGWLGTVLYTCPFVPAEWIAAHGLRPRRIMPQELHGAPLPGAGMGMCPYARAFLHEVGAQEDAAVVFTTVCDQMRRCSELMAPEREAALFLMHVPATWRTPGARRYYRAELERLGRFLERLGGTTPSAERLAAVMAEYDATRAKLRAAAGRLSAQAASNAIARLHRNGPADAEAALEGRAAPCGRGIRLALVGGPLLGTPSTLLDLIESAGGTIVLDATETGERTLPAPFDAATVEQNPLDALVDAYFNHIPYAFRRPNDALYAWLARELAARDVRGIIFRRYLWCDTWHAEAGRMAEWSPVPFLALDVEDDQPLRDRMASKIRAFVETLA